MVHYPKQEMKCSHCEGYKRVAIITHGPKLFDGVIGKPLPMTFAKAYEYLSKYKGKDAGALTMLVRNLRKDLNTTPCPWCKGTGITAVLRQLTPEEAAEFREKEGSNPTG